MFYSGYTWATYELVSNVTVRSVLGGLTWVEEEIFGILVVEIPDKCYICGSSLLNRVIQRYCQICALNVLYSIARFPVDLARCLDRFEG